MFSTKAILAVVASALYVQATPNLVSRGTFNGDATTYSPSVGFGACGKLNSDSDFVVAVGHELYDTYPGATPNPNWNPICGKTITATNPSTGASITVVVEDKCPGCAIHDLDMSPAAFAALYNGADTGRFPVTWSWA